MVGSDVSSNEISFGPRPQFLISQMNDSPLKNKLQKCLSKKPTKSVFSIGHRGAPLMFAEHTAESYVAAASMGAGILECDVSFTKDLELVCRHSQNDLHKTTNILTTELSKNCSQIFIPAGDGQKAKVECRTTDITLNEFKTLKGRLDSIDNNAASAEEYLDSSVNWRTNLYANSASTLVTHKESIKLFKKLGTKFIPELKRSREKMPFNGFTQEDYAQKLVDEYKNSGILASDVWLQSFNLADIIYWIENEPDFGKQAVFLDGRFEQNPNNLLPSMQDLEKKGVRFIAPPIWILLDQKDGRIVASEYAKEAKSAGLKIITWTLERSGPLADGGGWYFQTIKDLVENDGFYFEVLHSLATEVGVEGVFSDWPATVTFYANCMDLK